MKIFYGKKKENIPNSIFLDKSDIPIPTGKTFHDLPESLFKKLEQQKLDNIEFYKIFRYNNISLWWFIYPTIFTTFARTIFFIINFEDLLNKYKPESIKIIGEFEKKNLIKQICFNNNIIFDYSKLQYLFFKTKFYFLRHVQPIRYKIINNLKTKKRLSIFKIKKNEIPNLKDKIMIFLPTSYRRNIYNLSKKKTLRGEYLVEPIFELIEKMNINICGIDVDYSFRGQHEILKERLQNNSCWFPVEIIIKNYAKRESSREFLKKYQKIISSHQFRNLFTFKNVHFWEQLEVDFNMLKFKPYIPMYIEMYESFKYFFDIQKPTSILIPYETGPYALSLISACREKQIKTIGIEHGGLIVKHPDYIHDIFQTESNPLGMPIVDKLLVWGEFFKKALIQQANYPTERIIVFGNPMYFEIDKVLEDFDYDYLITKYHIPKNKKIILFTSATFQKYYSQGGLKDYDERILEELIKKFSNHEKYFIILKPHPTESYLESYKKIIKKTNSQNVLILQDNLFELMFISDVVVSFFSTSLIDSILLNKPTIRITFPGTEVTSQFTEYDIFLETELRDLFHNITKIVENEKFRNILLKNREKFIHDLYNIPNPKAYDQLRQLFKG